MNISKEVAKSLLEIKAVTLSPDEPYTWASGLKSPIYCDNRLTISYPEVRKAITEGLVELIKKYYPEVDAIVGTATAGIPQACWISDQLHLPMAYVRSSSKSHGKTNQIEGYLKPNSKVVVIEDLISTGGSSIKACEALVEEGMEVLSVMAIFTYEMSKAEENFSNANIKLHTLSNYTTLTKEALSLNYIDENQLKSLVEWRKDPQAYSSKFE